jgi:hypothetical protein
MDFYTSLFTATIIFLFAVLCFVGYFMSLSRKNQTYPPSVANCPDYYSLDSNGSCNIGADIKVTDSACNSENFNQDKYKAEGTEKNGTGFNSGLCAKKIWAKKCDVKWDGITNNDDICYD